jgi:RimJ/RimL family protein N-acetyltransferase
MEDKFTIRAARVEEAAQVRELRLEAMLKNPEAFSNDYETTLKTDVAHWEERIRGDGPGQRGQIMTAWQQDRLVGMAGVRRPLAAKVRHAGDIWGVYVTEAARGHGLAERMVRANLDWAREEGLVLVRLAVVTDNARAIRAYLKCGFTVYGVEPQATLVEGVYRDELLMVARVGGGKS